MVIRSGLRRSEKVNPKGLRMRSPEVRCHGGGGGLRRRRKRRFEEGFAGDRWWRFEEGFCIVLFCRFEEIIPRRRIEEKVLRRYLRRIEEVQRYNEIISRGLSWSFAVV